MGRPGVEELVAAEDVQPANPLRRAARGHPADRVGAAADTDAAADLRGASGAGAAAQRVAADRFRSWRARAGDRDVANGDGAAADEPPRRSRALHADRSGRARAELRRL